LQEDSAAVVFIEVLISTIEHVTVFIIMPFMGLSFISPNNDSAISDAGYTQVSARLFAHGAMQEVGLLKEHVKAWT
jgi:hypothetical protein